MTKHKAPTKSVSIMSAYSPVMKRWKDILHMIETLKPRTGRMAVVVPNGVLFRGSTEGSIRQKLVEENLLDAVIGLPDKLFFGTSIPAAILVFRKRKGAMLEFG